MNTQHQTAAENWIETQDHMPDVGQKVIVYLWMDKTVNQAWWNGEYYVLVAADEHGQVQIYQVLPEAISHWCTMPKHPALSDNVLDMVEHKLNGTLH